MNYLTQEIISEILVADPGKLFEGSFNYDDNDKGKSLFFCQEWITLVSMKVFSQDLW